VLSTRQDGKWDERGSNLCRHFGGEEFVGDGLPDVECRSVDALVKWGSSQAGNVEELCNCSSSAKMKDDIN